MTITAEAPPVPARPPHPDVAARTAELAARREQRFQERRKRLMADKTLPPALLALFLDRTPWSTTRFANELGITSQRVSSLRRPKQPRPSQAVLFPEEPDTIEAIVAGVEDPGVEAGRAREWAVKRRRLRWDHQLGILVPAPPSRHGRSPLKGRVGEKPWRPRRQSTDE